MIYKNYIHKLEDLSSIDPRHLVFRQETVAWLTPAVPPMSFVSVMSRRNITKECDQLQKGHHGGSKKVWFYVFVLFCLDSV